MKPRRARDRAGYVRLRTSYADWFNSKLMHCNGVWAKATCKNI